MDDENHRNNFNSHINQDVIGGYEDITFEHLPVHNHSNIKDASYKSYKYGQGDNNVHNPLRTDGECGLGQFIKLYKRDAVWFKSHN